MKTRESSINISIATVLILSLFAGMLGCNDNTMSPRFDHDPFVGRGDFKDVEEVRFSVGTAAIVSLNNFTGRATYRVGEPGVVRVVATRWARSRSGLERIRVVMTPHAGGVDLSAENPDRLRGAAVDFEITAPAGAIPDLVTGVGNIDYRGRPTGTFRFRTGVGSIKLRLPDDVNLTIDLSAAAGSVFVEFPVYGQVSTLPGVVRGRLGDGSDGHVRASTAVGSISVVRL